MNHQGKTPPIYVWVLTAVLVCLIAFSAFYFRGRSFIVQNKEKLLQLSTAKEKRVVAVGTSLLGEATFNDRHMLDFGIKKGFDGFVFLQMTKGGLTLEDVTPLLHAITDAKPDVVVLESNLLLFGLGTKERLNMEISRHKKYLKYHISKLLLNLVGSNPKRPERAGELPMQAIRKDSVTFRGKQEGLRKYHVRSVLSEEVESFFERAREEKMKILIFEVPRFRELEEVLMESPENRQKASDLIQYLKAKYDVEYLTYPEKLDLEYYMDFSHFNQKGREHYSLWLLSSLLKL